MELEIQGRMGISPHNLKPAVPLPGNENTSVKPEDNIIQKKAVSEAEVEQMRKALINDVSILNHDLKYYVDPATNDLVVKVIDKTTDKVIREIPAKEIQKLQAKMRETIGLLIDEKI